MRTTNNYSSLYFPFRLLFFYVAGLIFWKLLYIWFNDIPDVFQPIYAGIKLDLSMICGIFLAGIVPYWLFQITGAKPWLVITKYLHLMLWLFVCIIEFSSVLIYQEWGNTLDSRAISYLVHPKEAWASAKGFVPISVVFFGLLILVSGLKRISIIFNGWKPVRAYYIQSITFLVIIGPLAFLGLRGGWQKLPIVPSDAFYSSDMKNNFSATNKVWYFLYSLKKASVLTLNATDSEIQTFKNHYISQPCAGTDLKGKWNDKNIVLLIVEGWSADMVKYLYSKEDVTPFFDSLSEKSLKFTNAFSTGFRTDQGLMSILSGVPSVKSLNMPNVIDKAIKYPSLPREMKKMGRITSFVYGGDLNFSNLYNYLTILGFDTIISEHNFDKKDRSTAWGVPDHIAVQKAVTVIDGHDNLFFTTVLLLSSHAPFETPIKNEFSPLKGVENKYKASVKYSDAALKRFFELAQSKEWYQNSIFLITSDHGSTHSGWAKMEDHNRFRIPLIIYNPEDSLTKDKSINDLPCNHFDLPYTLSHLAGADTQPFLFSRDIYCADKNRKAYWNIDVAAAVYGKDERNIHIYNAKNPVNQAESVLFVDMVKKWFNGL